MATEKNLENTNPEDELKEDDELDEENLEELDTSDDEEDGSQEDSNEEPEDTHEESTLYTQEQVESAVKARVNTFNKKLERMKPFETAVKRIGEVTGLDVNTLISKLENLSDAQQAKILGITPEQVNQRRLTLQLQRQNSEQVRKTQIELEEQKLQLDSKYKDYSLFKDEVMDILEENPKLSVKQAYLLAKGETATKAAARDAEQRAVARMTKSSNQKVVHSTPPKANKSPKLDPSIVKAAKKVGMDPAEYTAYMGISDLSSYEKFKASKKG